MLSVLEIMALVKIFVGNLASEAGIDDLRYLFDKYGEVAECDVLKNFGFVVRDNLLLMFLHDLAFVLYFTT